MPKDYTERVGESPLDFQQTLLKLIIDIESQMSHGDHGLDGVRALHIKMKPYRDKQFRDDMEEMIVKLEAKRQNGMSPNRFNTILADEWCGNLNDLMQRRGFTPKIHAIKRGEELLQGI